MKLVIGISASPQPCSQSLTNAALSLNPPKFVHMLSIRIYQSNQLMWRSSKSGTVKTLYNDAGRTADRIVIPMVLLYMESRVGLISRKKVANAWLSIPKGCRASISWAK